MSGNKIIAERRADSRQQSAASLRSENHRTKKTLTRKIQVRVSLSLRMWWIASANPPYAVPYIDPPYVRSANPPYGFIGIESS